MAAGCWFALESTPIAEDYRGERSPTDLGSRMANCLQRLSSLVGKMVEHAPYLVRQSTFRSSRRTMGGPGAGLQIRVVAAGNP